MKKSVNRPFTDLISRRFFKLVLPFILLLIFDVSAQNSMQIGSEEVTELPTEARIPVELSTDVELSLLSVMIRFDPQFLQTSGDLIMANDARFAETGLDKVAVSINNDSGVITWTAGDDSPAVVIQAGVGVIFTIEFIVSETLLGNSSLLALDIVTAKNLESTPVTISAGNGGISAPSDKLSMGAIDVTTIPGIATTTIDLTLNTDLSFLSTEVVYDAAVLQIAEGGIQPQSERFSEAVDMTTSINNEEGKLMISISDNETDSDLELLGGLAVLAGEGAIFTLQFTINNELDCLSTALEFDNVTAFDPLLNPVKVGIDKIDFSLDHPSKGCVSFSREVFSCISEVNDIVEIQLQDKDFASEVLLEFTFEGETPEMNTGALGAAFNLQFSNSEVVADEGYRSAHSLFFDDPSDFAVAEVVQEETFDFPAEAGRLELWYKPGGDEIQGDHFLFSTKRADENSSDARHKFWISSHAEGTELVMQEKGNIQGLRGAIDLVPDGMTNRNQWHHIEFSWQPGSCSMRLDGVVVAGSTSCTLMSFSEVFGFAIGSEWGNNDENKLSGFIDNVRLYKTHSATVVINVAGEPGDREIISLQQVASENGVFKGAIRISDLPEPGISGDGILTVNDGSRLSVTYEDADDGTGSSATAQETAIIDCAPPTITVPQESITVPIGSALPDLLAAVSATNEVDGDLTDNIVINGADSINTNINEDYQITYSVVDSAGNPADEKTLNIVIDDNAIRILVDNNSVEIAEGNAVTVNARLDKAPAANVVIIVSRIHGDSDIQVETGSELTFTPENWNEDQLITLNALENNDNTDNGTATFLLRKKSGEDRVLQNTMVATEIDDDITLTVVGVGTGTTIPDGSVIVDADAIPYEIEAIAAAGEQFQEWIGEGIEINDPGNPKITVSPQTDVLVTARFSTKDKSTPTVTIINPSDMDVLTPPATIPVIVNAEDPDAERTITKVELFANGQKVGETSTSPYQFSWRIEVGDASLRALATNDLGTKAFSEPVEIQTSDFSFTFFPPEDSENSVLHSDPHTFAWRIPNDGPDFSFDLYLSKDNQIAIHDLGRAKRLNKTPLSSSFDNRFNYTHETGLPFDRDDGESTLWYPLVLIRDGAHQGEIHVSDHTLTVRGRENVTVEIVQPQEGGVMQLGQFLQLQAVISSADTGDNVEGAASIQLTSPEGVDSMPIVASVENGILDKVLKGENPPPNRVGDWQLTVTWPDPEKLRFNQNIDVKTIKVDPTDASIRLLNLGAPQVTGEAFTMKGKLSLLNRNPGEISLLGFEVEIVVKSPEDNTETRTISLKEDGTFEHPFEVGFFNVAGDWEVQARCKDDGNFSGCEPFIGTLSIRGKRGYAILQLGSIPPTTLEEDPEGLAEHQNTLNFVKGKMVESGILEEDINFLIPGSDHPKEQLRIAIEEWAQDKILPAPAPLYIIPVNHGDPAAFHMHPDDPLTPIELNNMITNLETAVAGNSLAAEENIVVILGMCYSGSFIDSLSKPGRVIISAAAADERSIRGPGRPDERQGEFFVYLLFRELSKGSSLLRSFTLSRDIIRSVSGDFMLTSNGSSSEQFPNEFGQHPLLDDDGDKVGSFKFTFASTDGQVAKRIFLVGDADIPILKIKRANPTIFLAQNDPIPNLFAEVERDSSHAVDPVIKLEVRTPDQNLSDLAGDVTMQAGLNLTVQDMTLDVDGSSDKCLRYIWPPDSDSPNPESLFLDFGEYQLIYSAFLPGQEAQPAEPKISRVFRSFDDNTPPSNFTLLTPENNAVIDFTAGDEEGQFTWSESLCQVDLDEADIERCHVRYIFQLWNHETEREADNLVDESKQPLRTTFASFTASQLEIGTFWWNVVAVDDLGNHKMSDGPFKVTVVPNNGGQGRAAITGLIKEINSGLSLRNFSVFVTNGPEVRKLNAANNGLYSGTLRFNSSLDPYTIEVRAPGFRPNKREGIVLLPPGDPTDPDPIDFDDMVMGIEVKKEGWNLVSTPLDLSPDNNLSSVDLIAWEWSGETFQIANEFTSGKGFWIWNTQEEFIETDGRFPASLSDSFLQGWNIIGVKGINSTALPSEMDILGLIWSWDAESGRYIPISSDEELIPGKGYWAYFKNSQDLVLGN